MDERGVHVLTAAAGGGREDAELPEARKQETETRRSSRACVKTLLAAGADADARMSRLGWKPLMAAAKAGDGEIVEMLIDAGARVDQTYHNGKTPLYCAAESGRLEAARALLRRGAASPSPPTGCTPITPPTRRRGGASHRTTSRARTGTARSPTLRMAEEE